MKMCFWNIRLFDWTFVFLVSSVLLVLPSPWKARPYNYSAFTTDFFFPFTYTLISSVFFFFCNDSVFVLLLDFSLTTHILLLGGVSFSTWRLNVIWMAGISLRTQNRRYSLIAVFLIQRHANFWNKFDSTQKWSIHKQSWFVLGHEQGQGKQAILLQKRDKRI